MQFQPVATGFSFLEAPRADDAGNVWFSEVVLGGIRHLRPDGSVRELLPGKQWIGGLALNEDGALLLSGRGGIAWIDPASGATGMLVEQIDGNPIGSVNDVQPDGRGGLYFGTMDGAALERGEAPAPCSLYRLDVDGRVTLLRDGLKISNGLGLSPDGRRLYHNETWLGTWAYDLAPDGSIARRTLLLEQPDCDGLAVDAEGGVWLAACRHGTLTRIAPDGTVDRRVELPVKEVTSLCFGGADGGDVYVTTAFPGAIDLAQDGPPPRTAALYHGRSAIAGLPLARTRFKLTGH